jgi:hypothetical protein
MAVEKEISKVVFGYGKRLESSILGKKADENNK